MLGPITCAVENRGSSTVNVPASRITSSTRSWRVTSQPSSAGEPRHRLALAQPRQHRVGIALELLERDRGSERERDPRTVASPEHVSRSPRGSQPMSSRWRANAMPVAVGVERLVAVAQQRVDPLEVVQQRQLAGRVVPLTGVVALGPGGERGQRLDLDLVLPPPRPDRQPVARRAARRRRSTAARTTSSARAGRGRASPAASAASRGSSQPSSPGSKLSSPGSCQLIPRQPPQSTVGEPHPQRGRCVGAIRP